MSEILKKINSNSNPKTGSFFINHVYEGKEQLINFENMYKRYDDSNNILLQMKFNNSYYVFVRDNNEGNLICVSHEYIDKEEPSA